MIIYKTTNLINGKFYIGKDVKNKNSYLGSGKILKDAIKKYGKENFKKEILEICDSLETLSEREKFWIKELKANEIGYNIAEGGTGGRTFGGGVKKGNIPWNKNKKTNYIPWNKSLKGYMGANKTSYKAGEKHPFYGQKRDPKIYEKIIQTRREKNNFKAVGNFTPKKVKNIEDGKIFDSIKDAAEYYNITRDKVGHSCRKETKKGKFRFV